jgi:hypothetical protein
VLHWGMRPLLLCPLIVAAFSACAPEWTRVNLEGHPTTVYVCVDLPKEEVVPAALAVRVWARALARWRTLEPLEGDDSACSYRIYEAGPYAASPTALAVTPLLGGSRIQMVKGRYEGNTYGIVLHEFGHALGAQHIPGTLMNANYAPHMMRCPDASTVAQVAAWHHMSLELLSWCY